MAKRSTALRLLDEGKKEQINTETLDWFRKYQIDMSIRELSPKSIYSYNNDLWNWFIYILDNQYNTSVLELEEDDIMEFLYFCKQHGNNSRRMKRRMATISALYKFLRRKRAITENPMEFIERPKRDVDIVVQTYLTKEQVELIKEKLIEHGDLQLLAYAMFSLSTMARVNAVSNTHWGQIDFNMRVVNDVLEKEGKRVTLYFSEEVKDILLRLKQQREEEGIECDYVFIAKSNGVYQNVSTSTLSAWTKKIGEMIGVPTLHCHDWRHSNAQLLKVAGCPIEVISDLLNHSGLDVTKKHYLVQDKEQMKSVKDMYEV